jgi:ribonuclease G
VSEGGDILVQVLKDPLGTKGARLTTFITIPSRYLVYMPFGHGVGISARIETRKNARGCANSMQSFVTPGAAGGYIVRTAAEGAAAEALRADMLFLRKLWEVLTERPAGAVPARSCTRTCRCRCA